MKVFYVRCSTVEQNEARQVAMAKENGIEKVYIDKASGKNTDRPEFQKMMAFVREGDIVVTESISRIARNTRDLLSIIDELRARGVGFISLKENIDTQTPQGKFMLTVFAAMAQFERECTRQRQAEGIAIAKANKVYKGRRRRDVDFVKFDAMCREKDLKMRTATSIQKEFGITATTFYRWYKERFDKQKQ